MQHGRWCDHVHHDRWRDHVTNAEKHANERCQPSHSSHSQSCAYRLAQSPLFFEMLDVLNCSNKKESILLSTTLRPVHRDGAGRRENRTATSVMLSRTTWHGAHSRQRAIRNDRDVQTRATCLGNQSRGAQTILRNCTARDPRCRTRLQCSIHRHNRLKTCTKPRLGLATLTKERRSDNEHEGNKNNEDVRVGPTARGQTTQAETSRQATWQQSRRPRTQSPFSKTVWNPSTENQGHRIENATGKQKGET